MKTHFFYRAGDVNLSDTLGNLGGFLVIYNDWIAVSSSDSTGHDDLLYKIAAEYHQDRTIVKNNGLRFYYMYDPMGIIISGSREIDNEAFCNDADKYRELIKKNSRYF